MSNILFEFFLCAVGYGIVYYFFNLLLKKRFFTIFPTVLTVLINSVIIFIFNDFNVFVRSLISICVLTVGCFVLYKDKPAEKVTYSLLALYILNIVEIITCGFFSILFRLNIMQAFEWSYYRIHFSAYAKIFDILVFTLIYKMASRIEPTLKNKYRFLFGGIIFVFFVSTNVLFQLFSDSDSHIFFNDREVFMYTVIFSLIFVMSLIVIFFFTEISRSFQRDSKLFVLESNYNNLQEQIEIRQHNEQQFRKLRHDMQNHLSNIRSLIENGENESAAQLLDQTAENIANALPDKTVNTGNKFIDAILLSKLAVCHNKNISFDYSVEYSEKLKIDVTDLSSLLSNLLDNAIEAASQTDKPFVKIRVFKYNAYYTICTENSYRGRDFIKHNAQELASTKSDITLHGYGTQIINDIALKYDGNFSWETKENSFIATVLLKI